MPNDVNTAPGLPNGRHEHATDAPDRRGPPSPPISPSQRLPSLLEVDQLKQECHSTRTDVSKQELLTEQIQEQNVEVVCTVPWRVAEEADYPTAFSCSSTSRIPATADLGTSRDSDTVSVNSQRIQSTLGDDQSFIDQSRGNDGLSIKDDPKDHHGSVDITLDVQETLSSSTLVALGPLDIAPASFHFSNPNELALSIPYPTMIIEDTLSLCCHHMHAEYINHVSAWQNNWQ